MITKFHCDLCQNDNPRDALFYDGAIGYEAMICAKCGAMYDESGIHKADEWSLNYIKQNYRGSK